MLTYPMKHHWVGYIFIPCSICFISCGLNILWNLYSYHQQMHVVKCSAMLVKVFQAVVCTVCRAVCDKLHGTQYTPQLETLFTNIAEDLTTYFYWISAQNCNFSKVRHRLPDDGPNGPKHVGAIMRYFNCIF